MGRFQTKQTAWLMYSLDVAVLEMNMSSASKVLNVLRKASERMTSLRGCCGVPSRLLRPCCCHKPLPRKPRSVTLTPEFHDNLQQRLFHSRQQQLSEDIRLVVAFVLWCRRKRMQTTPPYVIGGSNGDLDGKAELAGTEAKEGVG